MKRNHLKRVKGLIPKMQQLDFEPSTINKCTLYCPLNVRIDSWSTQTSGTNYDQSFTYLSLSSNLFLTSPSLQNYFVLLLKYTERCWLTPGLSEIVSTDYQRLLLAWRLCLIQAPPRDHPIRLVIAEIISVRE